MKESEAFIAGCQARNLGQLALKTPELPDGFQQGIFKGKVRAGGGRRVCDQLVHIL